MSVHQIIYEGEDDYYEEEEEDNYGEDIGVDDYDSGIETVHEYYERWFRQSLRILNNMGNAILQLQQQQVRAPPLMHQRTLTDIDNEYVRASEQLRNASDGHEVAYWNARRIELAAEAESQRVAAPPPPPAAEHAEIESGLVRDLEDARDRRRHDRRRRRDPWYDLREDNLSR